MEFEALRPRRDIAVIAFSDPGVVTPLSDNFLAYVHLNVDSVDGLFEAANSYIPGIPPGEPFTSEMAGAIFQFAEALQREHAKLCLVVTENTGTSRSAALADWIEARFQCQRHGRRRNPDPLISHALRRAAEIARASKARRARPAAAVAGQM
jgi:hypothetical protein